MLDLGIELQDDFETVNTQGKGDTRANERERIRIQGELKRITNEAPKNPHSSPIVEKI